MFFSFYNSNPSNELIIFHGLYKFSDKGFSQYITDEHLIHRFPDQVTILLSIQNKGKIKEDKITETVTNRFCCDLCIYFYNENGDIVTVTENGDIVIEDEDAIESKNYVVNKNNKIDRFEQLFVNGIKELENQHTPIIKPTHGHQFLKPSKEKSEYFIKLDNMLVKESEISFLALSIVRKLGGILNEDVINIYVDTPDLFYLIRLCCAIKFDDRKEFPHIKSFDSYDGYQEVLPRESKDSIVIISASSSGDLPREIVAKFENYQKNKILTILSTKNDNDDFTLLHQLDFEHTEKQKIDTPLIKIYGEKFIVSHEDDKWILLKKTENSPWLNINRGFDRFKCLIGEKDNILEKNTEFQNGIIEHPIRINSENLLKNGEFKEWCNRAINWHMPKTTKLVIYVDEKSKEFLDGKDSPVREIKKILFNRTSDDIKTTIDEILKNPEDFSVLVFAPVLSYGSVFTEISRELRKHKEILNINYIAGICTVPNIEVFNAFKANIEMSSYYKYNFHNYFTMNIGDFHNFAKDFRKEKNIIDLALEKEIIQKEEIPDKKYALCKDLWFADGFVFWEKNTYNDERPKELTQIAVLSTIAMVLQFSRELPISNKCSLQPSHTSGVALSPENFFRFNDAMIQAAILRSAKLHELNYASSKEKSISMQHFILNSIKDPPLFYEVLLSMATGKLLLHEETGIKDKISKEEKDGDAKKYWHIFEEHIQ